MTISQSARDAAEEVMSAFVSSARPISKEIISELIQSAIDKANAWRPISEAEPSTAYILTGPMEDQKGNRWVMCGMKSMDRWYSYPGRVSLNPTHYRPLPSTEEIQ